MTLAHCDGLATAVNSDKRLSCLAQSALELKLPVYLVGGSVRDILNAQPVKDVDLALEGDISPFLAYWENVGVKVIHHPAFHTGTLLFPNGQRVDIAMTRKEFYPVPASRPHIRFATIEDDLCRRDFSVNAMAYPLEPLRKGSLLDPCGGFHDLMNRSIRVLHANGFIDDPTRVFRAIRFELRLGFCIQHETWQLMHDCVQSGCIELLKKDRVRRELNLLYAECPRERVIKRLGDLGLDSFFRDE